MTRVLALALALTAASLVFAIGGSAAPAQEVKLFGTVGPEFAITLEDAQGNRVTKLDPGAYEIQVRDRSDFHTFHLQGPGVDERTQAEFTGEVTWRVTLRDGTYVFFCDVHPSSMRETFTAGTPQSPPPSQPPPSGGITSKTKLVLTSGPRYSITLKTSAGKVVRSLQKGTYTVVVRDRSRIHNAHLLAPGYNRATKPVSYSGTQTWKVKLRKAGSLRFLCDPHKSRMKGSAKIVG
jgi:plastocyanin